MGVEGHVQIIYIEYFNFPHQLLQNICPLFIYIKRKERDSAYICSILITNGWTFMKPGYKHQ
jgi:hypothetical protein